MEYQVTNPNPTHATVSTFVTDLRTRSMTWEKGALASSNTELYALLGACHSLYTACLIDPELTSGVEALLEQFELTFTKSTSLALKVVRVAFATKETQQQHKYRHLAYAQVLEVATQKNVTADALADFIIKKGGIDEIRRNEPAAKKGFTKDQLTAVAKVQLGATVEAGLIGAVKFSERLKPAAGAKFCIALIRADADDKGSIVYGINDAALVDRALEIAGKAIKEQVAKQAEEDLLKGQVRSAEAGAKKAEAILTSALSIKKTTVTA